MNQQEIIDYINENIDGRMCDEQDNCLYLASAIYEAGDGNYLEIGSLFGGTAIMASLIKRELGYSGDVYAIDPFDEYYKNTRNDDGGKIGAPVDPITRKEVTIGRAKANAENLGADVKFIKGKASAKTIPAGVRFNVVFIDGDHWNDAPWQDWLLVKDITDHVIVFDNCDREHPAVEKAVAQAWLDPEWSLVFKYDITAIMAKVKK